MMILTTPRLTVRSFRREDTEALAALLADPEVMRYLEPPYSRAQTEAFMETACLCREPPVYAVEEKGSFVGYVIYHPYEGNIYEIGWVLSQRAWGKGYAGELTAALTADAAAKGRRLLIECLPAQTASRRIALTHGFLPIEDAEGLQRFLWRPQEGRERQA